MNKLFKSINLFALAILLTTFGCGNDDDGAPQNIEINIQDLAVTIDENPTNGQVIGTVQTDGSGTLNFSITSQTPSGALSINTSTGELTVANAAIFDFEVNPIITATITVTNAVETAMVTVNLNNLNETTIQDLTVTIDENPTDGQVVGTFQTGGSATSNFSITAQTPAGALNIDVSTGELTVADATLFDFETTPILTATISVSDAENPATATINLTNVNEVNIQDFTVAIDENPTDGQVVGTVQTTGGVPLNFSITSQTPVGALNIDPTTGELTVADPNLFDFETTPILTATITVDDAENAATVTINLTDVDEITVQNATLDIDENPTNGQVIGTLQATSSGILTYTITYQSAAGALAIDASTGELTVADATLFDFETTPTMFATISVDNGVYSVSATASVNIENINEIGDFNHGGVIFWVDPTSNNSSGLVCAITDQGTNVSWGCQGTFISGTSDSIGSGATNTAVIVAGCTTTGIAADIASNATIDGYSDWFLPSRSELTQMYSQKAIINSTAIANGGAAFIDSNLSTRYWSSTESNNNTAWCKYFANGNDAGLNKGASAYFQVRAIRAF
ncbi:DUF1566 domain-containing protein [Maribacter sp.]|uniref:Lcl domain-containing protein n=1 Tax=Maribacter sp. TaxID=1897614 RepID=UPI0025C48C0E|nr:DUF1566 domain-containing protein [Maribacter sp.]